MGGQKTQDGIRLRDILKAADLAGAGIKMGSNHPYLLTHPGMRPCPIATSTHAERMVAPWLAQATRRNKQEVYANLREGTWTFRLTAYQATG